MGANPPLTVHSILVEIRNPVAEQLGTWRMPKTQVIDLSLMVQSGTVV
jgi:hypothetical protein